MSNPSTTQLLNRINLAIEKLEESRVNLVTASESSVDNAHLSNEETFTGEKTFTSSPNIPDLNLQSSGNGTKAVNKNTLTSAVSNIDGSNITSGTINVARLPATALERLITVNNQAARFALTTSSVQIGDTVKEADTGVMYRVVDDTNLDNASGYVEYTSAKTLLSKETNGVAQWDTSEEYPQYSLVRGSDGSLYYAKVASGQSSTSGSQNPVEDSNNEYWSKINSDDSNIIHKDGNEVISGVKVFENSSSGHSTGETVTDLIIRNPEVTRGTQGGGGIPSPVLSLLMQKEISRQPMQVG